MLWHTPLNALGNEQSEAKGRSAMREGGVAVLPEGLKGLGCGMRIPAAKFGDSGPGLVRTARRRHPAW